VAEPFTDQQLRDFARRVVESCTEDIDFMGVGEQFENEWSGLPMEEFDDVQRRVHDLASSATVTVSWPDEQGGDGDV